MNTPIFWELQCVLRGLLLPPLHAKVPNTFPMGLEGAAALFPLCSQGQQGTQLLSVPKQNYEAGCLWGEQVTPGGLCLSFPIYHKRISALPGCREVHK